MRHRILVLSTALIGISTQGNREAGAACPSCDSDLTPRNAKVARSRKLDRTCPSPTIKKGSMCVLGNDVTLDDPLQIDSSTHLNCQGFAIRPRIQAKPLGGACIAGACDLTPSRACTTSADCARVPSEPGTGLVFYKTYGAKVQNCNIERSEEHTSE